jgi:hypothetical protein
MISVLTPLPFGTPFRVHGLQPGRVYVNAQPGHGLVPDPSWVSAIEGAQPGGFDVGSSKSLELSLVVRAGCRRILVVHGASGPDLPASSVMVHDIATDAVSCVKTSPAPDEAGGSRQMLTLAPGTYDLWCKLSVDGEPSGLVGSTRAVFAPHVQDPVAIALRPAASVAGVLRDPTGQPLANHVLSWTCACWPLGESQSLYRATTDAQGAFELNAVPPMTGLRGSQPGTDLRPFAPGPHRGLEFVVRP